jgi:hypothetical protein
VARSQAPPVLKGVAYSALTYVISPYLMTYDLPALGRLRRPITQATTSDKRRT